MKRNWEKNGKDGATNFDAGATGFAKPVAQTLTKMMAPALMLVLPASRFIPSDYTAQNGHQIRPGQAKVFFMLPSFGLIVSTAHVCVHAISSIHAIEYKNSIYRCVVLECPCLMWPVMLSAEQWTTIVEDIKFYFVVIPVINVFGTLSNNMNLVRILSIFQEIVVNCHKMKTLKYRLVRAYYYFIYFYFQDHFWVWVNLFDVRVLFF